jgi:hypothetical protein
MTSEKKKIEKKNTASKQKKKKKKKKKKKCEQNAEWRPKDSTTVEEGRPFGCSSLGDVRDEICFGAPLARDLLAVCPGKLCFFFGRA